MSACVSGFVLVDDCYFAIAAKFHFVQIPDHSYFHKVRLDDDDLDILKIESGFFSKPIVTSPNDDGSINIVSEYLRDI